MFDAKIKMKSGNVLNVISFKKKKGKNTRDEMAFNQTRMLCDRLDLLILLICRKVSKM